MVFIMYISFIVILFTRTLAVPVITVRQARDINIGPCTWVIDRKCPDDDIKFYLFTRSNQQERQEVHIDETLELSNLTESFFNPAHPVKVILHGYNSDMFLTPLIDMKDEYLGRGNYNLFYVDWSKLAPGPCYPSAVHNTRHTGICVAQLISRLLDAGTDNVHIIGFSLGAHVTNYIASTLKPFRILRITGLDPAMPLFITANIDEKLDPTDAEFVDVIHTNALVQGKIERCGHVDFYMNGGILQPGCMSNGNNAIACSHHRAPDYYQESIRSLSGFWGWKCHSYIYYLLGFCPPNTLQVSAGEDCPTDAEGMYLINTNPESPFAIGRWTNLGPNVKRKGGNKYRLNEHYDPLLHEIDQWGKLEGNFNNIMNFPTPLAQDPIGDEDGDGDEDDWPYFNHLGTNLITKDNIRKIQKRKKNSTTNLENEIDNRIRYLEEFKQRLHDREAFTVTGENYKLPVFNEN